MEPSQILQYYDNEQRIRDEVPLYRREEEEGVIRHIPLQPGRNGFVIYSRLDESNADRLIQAQIDRFTSLGVNFEWKLFAHDTPPDLKERLLAHGFVSDEEEAILVLDLQEAPESIFHSPAEADPAVSVVRLERREQLRDVLAVEEAVWESKMDWLLGDLGAYLEHYSDQASVYAAYVNGVPASSAWAFYSPGSQFVGLYGGSTLAEHRGRGLYTALIAARAREARQRGRRFLTVDASEMSRPILEKRGFLLMGPSNPMNYKVHDGDLPTD